MFIWWGEELINLYNDAYKSILGGKHPEALGQPASVVWREIWDEVGPRAATAMRANEGTYDEALLLVMERNGYPEETYYTFSYSPVPNDQGGTDIASVDAVAYRDNGVTATEEYYQRGTTNFAPIITRLLARICSSSRKPCRPASCTALSKVVVCCAVTSGSSGELRWL